MKRDYAAAAEQNNQLHNFQLSPPPPHNRLAADYLPTSEDSLSPTAKKANNALDYQLPPPPPPSNDGSTVEVSRRPRGRPPGSKNRPKPPSVVEVDSSPEPSMSPYVLQIPAGVDVVETTARFCRRKGVGLCLLCGNGAVANVTLKQPLTNQGRPHFFQGQFDIVSISGTVLPGGGGYPPAATNAPFAVTLAGPQGQVFGGTLAGPLISAGTMYLTAATFNCPSFERLPTADQEDAAASGRDGGRESQQEQPLSGGEIGGGPFYSYQTTDVVWAPSTRQQQPSAALPHY